LSKPRYSGTWKEQVLKAIAINGALWWADIQKVTGLDEYPLNRALTELFQDEVIEKQPDGSYWIEDDLFQEYKAYYDTQLNQQSSETTDTSKVISIVKAEPVSQDKLINGLQEWVKFQKRKDTSLELSSNHIYLKGDLLSSLTTEIIEHSEREILVVNPFVEKCHLSDKLVQACRRGVKVTLITNSPKKDFEGNRKIRKIEFHKAMKDAGVNLHYNDSTHAKLILVDGKVGSISSMNFYSDSTGGRLWEAGVISIDEKNVTRILGSFKEIETSAETNPVLDDILTELLDDARKKRPAFLGR
jgi:phosphatidylserine/phosphatidylglycerophosphate/cardiolipin synthase-like enzyme